MQQTNHTKVTWDEVNCGPILGTGSFSQVHRVRPREPFLFCPGDCCDNVKNKNGSLSSAAATDSVTSCHEDAEECGGPIITSGSCSCAACSTGRSAEYALKRLHGKALRISELTPIAAAGLVMEQKILSALPENGHIVQLIGSSHCFDAAPESGFLILELLHSTLDNKLRAWRNHNVLDTIIDTLSGKSKDPQQQQQQGLCAAVPPPKQRTRISTIGVQVARGMTFLHEHKVLYRDLKPANIGFDEHGHVRIFDFGLSRFFETSNEEEDKNLTMGVGSFRYMSPEIASGLPYSFPADVHSFALLLWELCTLKKPFSSVRSPTELVHVVSIEKKRPSLRGIRCPDTKQVVKAAWNPNPELRPSFEAIVSSLSRASKKHA